MGLPATVPSGFCLLGILYFFLEVRPPAHCRASTHFFSEISYLRFARIWGRHRACLCPVRVSSPFHPTGVWLFRREFGPSVGLLVPCPLVRRAPPDLDGDVWSCPPEHCDVVPCLGRVHLARARLLRGYTPVGCLSIREDRDPFVGVCRLDAVSNALARVVHSAAPSSSRGPSVNIVSPGLVFSDSAFLSQPWPRPPFLFFFFKKTTKGFSFFISILGIYNPVIATNSNKVSSASY